MQDINREIKEMRMERYKDSPKGFVHEESSNISHYWCEHSALQPVTQHSTMPTFLARGNEVGETQKEENLGDYLLEYESQYYRFKEHLNFQGFCQIKENIRSNNHNRSKGCMQHTFGRFFLPTFDGSPK